VLSLRVFFRWYNGEHRHSGIGLLTPATVHYGPAESVLRHRQEVLDVAYRLHPERFVRSAPKPPALLGEVWINKPVSGNAACGRMQMNRSNLLLKKRNALEKRQKRGCCGSTELLADRRCYVILARNFLWKARHPNPTDKKLSKFREHLSQSR